MRIKTLDQKWIKVKTNFSKRTWLKNWFKYGTRPEKLPQHLGQDLHLEEGWKWIHGGVQIIKDVDLRETTTRLTAHGIKDLAMDLNLNLQIRPAEVTNDLQETAPFPFSTAKRIDVKGLMSNLFEIYPAHLPHAFIYITNRPLLFHKSTEDIRGFSNFNLGICIISHQEDEAELTAYYRAQHEFAHLLGYMTHHETWQVSGYEPTNECVMMGSENRNDPICPRCSNALMAFWRGLEQKTGKRFSR